MASVSLSILKVFPVENRGDDTVVPKGKASDSL
jgi:hypothetical protein